MQTSYSATTQPLLFGSTLFGPTLTTSAQLGSARLGAAQLGSARLSPAQLVPATFAPSAKRLFATQMNESCKPGTSRRGGECDWAQPVDPFSQFRTNRSLLYYQTYMTSTSAHLVGASMSDHCPRWAACSLHCVRSAPSLVHCCPSKLRLSVATMVHA